MSLQTYPILILPSNLVEQLQRCSSSCSPESASQKNKQFLPTRKRSTIDSFRLRLLIRICKWSGLFIFGALVTIFVGELLFQNVAGAFLWFSIAIASAVISWGVLQVLYYLEKLRALDEKNFEKLYWQQNLLNNQKLQKSNHDRYRQNIVSRNIESGKFKIAVSGKSEGVAHSLTRGEIKGEAPKGVSEAYLAKFLQKYFADCQICEEYFAIKDSKIGYTTDFSIVEPSTGIGIDLEVDEPYEGRTKQPHHCTDNAKDRNRNKFLVERGWIVLRVSEFQVVSQPESVCKLVGKVLYRLSGKSHYIEPLLDVPDLKSDPTWNSVGVKNMVFRKYRERYLDKYGIFAYDEERERRNAADYAQQKLQALKNAKARKRKNLKAWPKRNGRKQ